MLALHRRTAAHRPARTPSHSASAVELGLLQLPRSGTLLLHALLPLLLRRTPLRLCMVLRSKPCPLALSSSTRRRHLASELLGGQLRRATALALEPEGHSVGMGNGALPRWICAAIIIFL